MLPIVTRRELIKTGIAGAFLLSVAGCMRSNGSAQGPFDDASYTYRQLSRADRTMFAAIAVAMLAGALPEEPRARAAAIVQAVRGVDVALDGLPPGMTDEAHQLFGLLEFPLTRGVTAGIWSSWNDAASSDVSAFLNNWRLSGFTLFRSGYQALHQLLMSAWYGNSISWARIGYPGPPRVG